MMEILTRNGKIEIAEDRVRFTGALFCAEDEDLPGILFVLRHDAGLLVTPSVNTNIVKVCLLTDMKKETKKKKHLKLLLGGML